MVRPREATARGERPDAPRSEEPQGRQTPISTGLIIKTVAPDIIAGAADHDPTTVGTLAFVGAQTGLMLAWLLVTPFTLPGIEPITLLFIAGIIGGIGTPRLLVLLLRVAGDRGMMRVNSIPGWLLGCGWVTAGVVAVATIAYFVTQLL